MVPTANEVSLLIHFERQIKHVASINDKIMLFSKYCDRSAYFVLTLVSIANKMMVAKTVEINC